MNFGPTDNGIDFTIDEVDFSQYNFYFEDGQIRHKTDNFDYVQAYKDAKTNAGDSKSYLRNLNRYFDDHGKLAANDSVLYIQGDFTESLAYARNNQDDLKYVLTTDNCAWVVGDMLTKSLDPQSQVYQDIDNLLWSRYYTQVADSIGGIGRTRYVVAQRTVIPNKLAKDMKKAFGDMVTDYRN